MKINTIQLENFQSYEDDTISFESGVSLFHGDNGAGKSTVLRAIFAGLFQTDMRKEAASDFASIGELVTTGKEEGGVVLSFSVGNEEYTLTWKIAVDDPGKEPPKGSTKECVLEGTTLKESISGVSSVREIMQTEIIGMDAQAFVNSVYVQQDEVMRLVNADKKERKQIFDDLLGLSKVDAYIERTVKMRREAKAKQRELSTRQEELNHQLKEEHPDKNQLIDRKENLNRELKDEKQKLETHREKLKTHKANLDDVQNQLQEYRTLKDEEKSLNETVDELNNRIENTQHELENLNSDVSKHNKKKWQAKSNLTKINSDNISVDLTDKTAVDEALSENETKRVESSSSIARLEESLESTHKDLKNSQKQKEDHKQTLKKYRNRKQERVREFESAKKKLHKIQSQTETLRERRDAEVREFFNQTSQKIPENITQETQEIVDEVIYSAKKKREATRNKLTKQETNYTNKINQREKLRNKLEKLQRSKPDTDKSHADTQTEKVSLSHYIDNVRNKLSVFRIEKPLTDDSIDYYIKEAIPELQAKLEKQHEGIIEQQATLTQKRKHLENQLNRHESLSETHSCPFCESDLGEDFSKRLDDSGKLETKIENVNSTLGRLNQEESETKMRLLTLSESQKDLINALKIQTNISLNERLEKLSSEKQTLTDEIERLEDQMSTTKEQINSSDELINKGLNDVVPKYEDVEDSENKASEYEENKKDARIALEELEQDIKNTKSEIASIDEDLEELESQETKKSKNLEKARTEKRGLETRKSILTQVSDNLDAINTHQEKISQIEQAKSSKNELLKTLREQQGEKVSRLETVKSQIQDADLGELQEKSDDIEKKITNTGQTIQQVETQIETATTNLANTNSKIESYNKIRARISDLDTSVEWAAEVCNDMNDIIDAYESVKLQMRKNNIELINAYTNEVFDNLYSSESYHRVLLSKDYSLRLVRNNGDTVSPTLSSGGEAAILNIAVRAGVYRTIIEQNQTSESGLPPFILDEPTTFLDSSHVKELERVIDGVEDWNVNQVVVVSHDDTLIDSADHEYRVRKDSTTDRSICEKKSF